MPSESVGGSPPPSDYNGIWDFLEHQLTLACAYYHCVVLHRGLRQCLACPLLTKGDKVSSKKWKSVTPAMAAGLTTSGQWMSYSVFVCHPSHGGHDLTWLFPVAGTQPIFLLSASMGTDTRVPIPGGLR